MELKDNFSTEKSSNLSDFKNKKTALFLLIGPFICLIIMWIVLGILHHFTYLANSTVNTIMIICTLEIVVCIPLGIIVLGKKKSIDGIKYNKKMIFIAVIIFIILLFLFIYFFVPLPFLPGSLATGKIQTLNSYLQEIKHCRYPATC